MMRTATLIESRHDWQGWAVVLTEDDGSSRLCGTVAMLGEAVALAQDNAAQLIVAPPARAQMESAGCAPMHWPADLNAPAPQDGCFPLFAPRSSSERAAREAARDRRR